MTVLMYPSYLQVQKRSYEIWKGEDGLEAEHQRRSAAREKRKEQKYAKEIKGVNMCMQVVTLDLVTIRYINTVCSVAKKSANLRKLPPSSQLWLSFLYRVEVYSIEYPQVSQDGIGNSRISELEWWKTQHICSFDSHFTYD